MRKTSVLLGIVAIVSFSSFARADIIGFNGPWDPTDAVGNLLNYQAAPLVNGAAVSVSVSSDHSTLTIDFTNPAGGFSLFTNYIDETQLPTGTVSYDWSVDFMQSGTWLLETGVNTTLPAGDSFGSLSAGVYTGTASLNYTSGNYFSFGNIGFGSGAEQAILTLTNFQYTGAAFVAPEPATAITFAVGLVGFLLVLLVQGRNRRA